MAEQKLPKLTTRVRFPSPAPPRSPFRLSRKRHRPRPGPTGSIKPDRRSISLAEVSMANRLAFLGLGAALMYLYDPQAGRKRRANLNQRIESVSRRLQQG